MTQTIAEYQDGSVYIMADYGQGRRGKAKIFTFSRFDLKDLKEMILSADQNEDDGWEDGHYCAQALETFAAANRSYIWRISSESGCGGAMDGVQEFHATKRAAIAEAMAQRC